VNLPFCQEFDVIVAFASLHWTADISTVLQGIKSSLAPGGRFAAQLMAKRHTTQERSGSPLHQARREVMARPAWRPYFRGFKKQGSVYSADEYERLLCNAGFSPYRIEFVTEDVTHPGIEALKGCAFRPSTATPFLMRSYNASLSSTPLIVAARYMFE
jgi:trans-aconitate methyltransferase